MAAYTADRQVSGTHRSVFLAELGLDGRLRHAPGVLPSVLAAVDAGHPDVVVAADSVDEARLVPGARVQGFETLAQVIRAFGGTPDPVTVPAAFHRPDRAAAPNPAGPLESAHGAPREAAVPDLADVVGQQEARYALEVAAAGGHHLLLEGSPGAGKTMMAERLSLIHI